MVCSACLFFPSSRNKHQTLLGILPPLTATARRRIFLSAICWLAIVSAGFCWNTEGMRIRATISVLERVAPRLCLMQHFTRHRQPCFCERFWHHQPHSGEPLPVLGGCVSNRIARFFASSSRSGRRCSEATAERNAPRSLAVERDDFPVLQSSYRNDFSFSFHRIYHVRGFRRSIIKPASSDVDTSRLG
ncbi:hypothetical protein L209DRAFT_178448 [Thermothelomyces heterothallicus CBS 203.75]